MKVPYAQVAMEVEKLYSSCVQESQLDNICHVISTFLSAAGWTEEEYWNQWSRSQDGLDNLPTATYIS